MEPKTTEKITYFCDDKGGHDPRCLRTPSADCPICRWKKVETTRRHIPDCHRYHIDPTFVEVYMSNTGAGQRFFHGQTIWEQDPQGEYGVMIERVVFTEQVPPFTEIHACQQDYVVRFYIRKVQLIAHDKGDA